MSEKPTLAEVAREAGTSQSTASRALSGRGYVSDEVRDRTFAAAEKLGYIPSAPARALKQRTSRVIGVVVSDLGNPFYGKLAAGIEQTLREANYQMMLLGDNNEDAEELAGARTFVAMRAPGVIMTPVGSDATELLASYGTAVVEVDRQLATIPCDAVVIDNEYGARLATQHLIDLGHHRIGFLGIDTDWTSDAGRLRGYKAAVTGRRRTYHPRLVVRVPLHAADVDIRISRLLDLRPTAIFAANNLLAERAWRVLRQRKLRLPDDISLVGFDDVPWMDMVEPGITVVAQPTLEMGRRAAALLIERLQDGTRPPAVEVLRPRLVVRGSTGPPQV